MIERVPLLVVAADGAPSLEIARVARDAGCSPILCDDRSSARRALVANRLFLAVVETGDQVEIAADLCSWLRQQPGGRQIRIIACHTGDWAALLPLIDAGADDLATFTGPEQTLGSRLTIAKACLLSRHRESPVDFASGVTSGDPDRPYLLPHELLTRLRQMVWDDVELPRLYRSFVEGAAASFGFSQIAIYTLEDDVLELQHLVGFDRHVDRIPLDRGVVGRTARTDRPNVVEDVSLDPDFIGGVSNIASEICVPFHAGGRVIGAINIESLENDRLDARDLPLVLALRDHLEAAIAHIQAMRQLGAELTERDRTFDETPAGLFSLDADLRLTRLNRAAAELLGLDASHALGRELSDLCELDRALLERSVRSARNGATVSLSATHGEQALEITLSGDDDRISGAIRDISTQRLTATRLDYTEWALDQIAATDIVIATVDRTGKMVPIKGVHARPLPGAGRWTEPINLRALIDERDWPVIAAALADPERSGSVLRVRLRTETGDRGWLHIRFAPADTGGARLMIARDVTGDAARDAMLVAAYHRLQISFDNPIAPSALLDASGRLIDVSPSLADLVGLQPEDMEGLPFQQLTYPEDVETALQHFREVVSGELPFCVGRYRFFHRDGQVVPLLVHLAPVPVDIERPGSELLVTVVSLEREAEIEYQLRSVQSRYDSLVSDLPIVTFTSPRDDQDQRLHFLGPQATKMLGYSVQHLSVTGDRYYEYIHPDDLERVSAADERVERDNAPFDETYRFIRGDGRVIWVRVQSVPVVSEPGQAPYWQGVITEVTELKEAELAALARERRLSALLATAPILVAVLDRDAAIAWINDAVEPLLGYRAGDLVSGRAALDIHPDDREVLRREFSDLLHDASSAGTIDIRVRHAQGSWQRLHLDLRVRRDDGEPELLLYGWPVEERVE